ncbi:MAG: ABC transporter permease [Desulfobacterales bacterium]|nr:ABC transporter permease [Desulfobacterales bacterium]
MSVQDWRENKLVAAILLVPSSAWLLIFFTLPLAIVWVYSFGERGPQGQTYLALNFENYKRALEWIHIGILWKSTWIAFVATALCFIMGFPLALGIAFAPTKYKNLLMLLVILPFWTNLLIRTYAWIAVLRTRGFLNFFLEWVHGKLDALFSLIGLSDLMGVFEPLALLYNTQAIIIGLVYVSLPFMVLPIYATLEKLDKSYLEASLDLGAGQWRTLFSVTMPLSFPGIFSGVMLVFIISLGTYLTPVLLGGADRMMIGNLIAQEFGPARDWPFGSALSFVLLYITFIILWLRAVVSSRSKGVSY